MSLKYEPSSEPLRIKGSACLVEEDDGEDEEDPRDLDEERGQRGVQEERRAQREEEPGREEGREEEREAPDGRAADGAHQHRHARLVRRS